MGDSTLASVRPINFVGKYGVGPDVETTIDIHQDKV